MTLKQLRRKAHHLRYLRQTIRELRYDIVNTTMVCSAIGGLTPEAVQHIMNNALLIRKYERRRKWLKL
jgi:hypothetical protein